jgi:hypothetical protein
VIVSFCVRGHRAKCLQRPRFARAVSVPCGRRLILTRFHSQVVDPNICSSASFVVTVPWYGTNRSRKVDAYRPAAPVGLGAPPLEVDAGHFGAPREDQEPLR